MAAGGFYDVLGVAKDASADDIRRAFRRIARTCHPDVAGEDEEKAERFRTARTAYEILSDVERRAEHDRALEPRKRRPRGDDGAFFRAFYRRASEGGRSSGPASAGSSDDPSLDELFKDFGFGSGAGAPRARTPRRDGGRPSRGEDLIVDVDLPEDVARAGGRVSVEVARRRRRTGWRPGEAGDGLESARERVALDVSAGTGHAAVKRFRGLGHDGPHGGPSGDLVARFRVTRPTASERPDGDAADASVVDIGVVEALLGGRVPVDTPAGRVRLTVPPGTSSGATFRLRGRGEGGADLHVRVRIVVPDQLDEEARRAVEALARVLPEPPER